MKEATDEIDKKEDEVMENIKKQIVKEGFFKKLAPYNKPIGNIILGICVSAIQGCIFPVLGIFMAKILFSFMLLTGVDKDAAKK